jgi:hypothetical protein
VAYCAGYPAKGTAPGGCYEFILAVAAEHPVRQPYGGTLMMAEVGSEIHPLLGHTLQTPALLQQFAEELDRNVLNTVALVQEVFSVISMTQDAGGQQPSKPL